MTIKTLDLKAAADFLKMTPEGLRRKVVRGEIPGSKPGKRWCFLEDELAQYVRSIYTRPAKVSWGAHRREKIWHSTNEKMFGGSASRMLDADYNKALEQPVKRMRKESTTK